MTDKADAVDRITDDVLPQFLAWRAQGLRAAVVTLIKVEGGGYRPLGAQMAVCENGDRIGYISDGCLENAIADEAAAALRTAKNRLVQYGEDADALDFRLPCGAAIELFIDIDFNAAIAERIADAQRARRSAALEYDLRNGAVRLIETTPKAIASRNGDLFVRTYHPRMRILVIGAAAGVVTLARHARLAGCEVEVASPDQGVLDATRQSADSQYLLTTPSSLPEFSVDGRTAVALLFHDHDWEVEILKAACGTDAFYIGAMGSRQTHAGRLDSLSAAGVSETDLLRIKGPAGLFPGGRNAPEIALSILGEIMLEARNTFMSHE